MSKVMVKNITNIDQTVLDIPKNEAVVLKPSDKYAIDDYTIEHEYLYRSYQRKGLIVTVEKDDAPAPKKSKKTEVKEAPVEIQQVETPVEMTEVVEAPAIEEPVEAVEIKTEEVAEIAAEETPVEEKPKKRSRKSTKNSDNSEK